MVHAKQFVIFLINKLFRHSNQRRRDVASVSRAAKLVGNHAQRVAACAQAKHGFHEIIAVFAKHPSGSQDDVARAGCLNGLFASQFAFAVSALRCDWVGFAVGGFAFAVKYIVCGNVQDDCANFLRGKGEIFRACAVNRVG